MAISGISNDLSSTYEALSSGKRINSAADDASGLAIAEKMETQVNGFDVGSDNALAGKDLIRTADSALGSIEDSLQRIRELSVKASNGIYGADELSAIQKEVDQIKQGIQDTAKGTSFNSISLLDGSMADIQLATNPDGKGSSIKLYNSTLEGLGIDSFDVTGNFNIDDIDKAINQVSEARSSLEAQDNALTSTINYNRTASFNASSSQSKVEDADMFEQIIELNRKKALEDYRMYAQRSKQEQDNNMVVKMFQ